MIITFKTFKEMEPDKVQLKNEIQQATKWISRQEEKDCDEPEDFFKIYKTQNPKFYQQIKVDRFIDLVNAQKKYWNDVMEEEKLQARNWLKIQKEVNVDKIKELFKKYEKENPEFDERITDSEFKALVQQNDTVRIGCFCKCSLKPAESLMNRPVRNFCFNNRPPDVKSSIQSSSEVSQGEL